MKKLYLIGFIFLLFNLVFPYQLSAESGEGDTQSTSETKDTESDLNNNSETVQAEGTDTVESELNSTEENTDTETSKNSTSIQSTTETTYTNSPTSKIGRIQGASTKIYQTIGESSSGIEAGDKYTNKTFYINKQAEGNGQVFYLISTEKSNTDSVIGWVKAANMTVQKHERVDNDAKTLYLDGTGWAYMTPWGATKDIVNKDLSPYTYNEFNVNLTEKVGEYIWYRGSLNGKTMWIQGLNADESQESKTSKVGRIQNKDVSIYKTFGDSSSSFQVKDEQIDNLFYIKKQVKTFNEVFYLISNIPSSTEGVVGWVNSDDIRVQNHDVENEQPITLYLDGTGWAYSKPWGGAKDILNGDLSPYTNLKFIADRTEKVGNYTWYHGQLNGEQVWIQGFNFLENQSYEESKTSKVGRIQNSSTNIFKNISEGTSSFEAGTKNTNKLFYITRQAEINGQTYYLVSNENSSTNGVVGWVRSDNIRVQNHTVIDKRDKTLYLDGTGWAYNEPWGGTQDIASKDLAKYKFLKFKINQTERIGNYIWYRGDLNGKMVWVQGYNFFSKVDFEESTVSKVGRIQNANTYIYHNIYDNTLISKAGNEYTDNLLYIKKQAEIDQQTYYLVSTKRSSTNGVVGWVKSKDIKVQTHKVVNNQSKTLYLDGTGWAYTDPWGGSKDIVSKELAESQIFKVSQTEKVGNYFWHRGTLNGQTVWIQAFNVKAPEISNASKVGRVGDTEKIIYQTIGDVSSSFKAGSKYTDKLFYIKQKARVIDQLYYKISNRRSSTNGVVGWIKAGNIRTQNHVRVDSKDKMYFLDGTGWAYSNPWGGSKDVVLKDLSPYKEESLFKINLTEKIGDYIWYRGTLDGKTVWIQSFNVIPRVEEKTQYDLTLDRMTDIQMAVNPQTDKHYKLWIREDAFEGNISDGKGIIEGNNWNLRRGPSTSYAAGGQVDDGTVLTVKGSAQTGDWTWYHVRYTSGWVTPDKEDVEYYLNPSNFKNNFKSKLQFLNLSYSTNSNVQEVNNKILQGKGILAGRAQSFINGGHSHGVNEIYLIAHALLETGNGTSKLATGVKHNGRTVYNMYGIGAKDSCPLECGKQYAYNAGWFTPEAAIEGGAAFVGNNYIGAGQDTLYKMRWNPLFASNNGYASHQYASDIGWAYKQTTRMYDLYNLLDSYSLLYDIPNYR